MVNHVKMHVIILWELAIQENNVLHLLVLHVSLEINEMGALLLFLPTSPCKLFCPRLPESAEAQRFFHFLEDFSIFIQESLGSWSLEWASQSQ